MKKLLTPEQELEVVRVYTPQDRESLRELAAKYNVSVGTLYNVLVKHNATPSRSSSPAIRKLGARLIDITGQTFGELTALKPAPYKKSGQSISAWDCVCACGNHTLAEGSDLRQGRRLTCGRHHLGKRQKTNILGSILTSYKRNAKSRGLNWLISKEQGVALLLQPCHYCGIAHSNNKKSHYPRQGTIEVQYNGIDRVDNSKGYTINNVVPCCMDCNLGKMTKTKEEFLSWIKRVAEFQKSQESKYETASH